MFKRISTFAIALTMTIPMLSLPAFFAEDNTVSAETGEEIEVELVSSVDTVDAAKRENTYSAYYDRYAGKARPDKEVVIAGSDYTTISDNAEATVEDFEGKNALVWKSQEGTVTYTVNIPETGLYNIETSYYALAGTTNSVELSLLIDGKSPFDTATRITLNKVWINEYPTKLDSKDNETKPPQVESPQWVTTPLKDVDGLFNEPLMFYFEAGEHVITLDSTKAKLAIEYIKFYNEKARVAYSTIKPTKEELDATPSFYEKIEGELAVAKTYSTLSPTFDRTSYTTSPSNPTKMRYNTIGSLNWKKSTQAITWDVTVQNAGYYKIGIKARQQDMRGFYSNRRLYIDGVVPCEEAAQIKFMYSTKWTTVTPKSNSGETLYFYLEAGTHKLTLEAIPGEIGDSMRRLDDTIYQLNTYYRQILQITGPKPDEYNSYYIDLAIPTIIDDFKAIKKSLYTEKDYIETLSGAKGSEAVALEKMAIILDRCIKKPDLIPTMLTQIKDNITSISSWMRDYRDQPLEIDYLELTSADKKFKSTDEKFFKSMKFGFKAFIGSFFEDYSILSDENEDSLNVWVSLGRDQAQAVKQMVDSYFVPEFNIQTNINLVQGGIIEAVLAGKGPDIALFIGGDFPINLAARDVLVDLTEFPDYEEVKDRFATDATTLYTYDEGVYGLPVSQSFPMLFYRKDVLESFGYDAPPNTWDELIGMLPILQRSYMNVGLVLPPTLLSTTTEAGHTFAMLLLQQGINYYNEERNATLFDTQEAVSAFETWTKFYTTFNFLQTYDAFTRFRTGEMPLVIQNYTFYNQLSVAAPEIKGLWNFTTVPGTVQKDGTISKAANSAGSGAIIFKKVHNKESAWKFVKWFTSTETQIRYGNTIEAILGPLGRFDTANVEAIEGLSWSKAEHDLIISQMNELVEIPIIPASYSVTRNVMNAFRTCVNDAENPRETLLWYNRDINIEIIRKRQDLGIDKK